MSRRESRQLLQPLAAAAVLVPQHWEERLVEGEVASSSVARIDQVDVGRVEAGLDRDQVGHERPSLNLRLVGARAVEGEGVVERTAAGIDHHRYPLDLSTFGCRLLH